MVLFLLILLAILVGAALYLFIFKKKKDLLPQKTAKPNLSVQPLPPSTPPAISPKPPVPPPIPPRPSSPTPPAAGRF